MWGVVQQLTAGVLLPRLCARSGQGISGQPFSLFVFLATGITMLQGNRKSSEDLGSNLASATNR